MQSNTHLYFTLKAKKHTNIFRKNIKLLLCCGTLSIPNEKLGIRDGENI